MNSRDKGARGEREIVDAYRSAGYPAVRTPLSGGMQWKGDLIGVPGLGIEVKRNERLNIWAALDQCTVDTPLDHVPALHFRRSRSPWWVAIPLPEFIALWQLFLSAGGTAPSAPTPSSMPTTLRRLSSGDGAGIAATPFEGFDAKAASA